jgi:hypothetical protein
VPSVVDESSASSFGDQPGVFHRLAVTSVLDEDLGLAKSLASDRLERARSLSRALVVTIRPGAWEEPKWPNPVRQGPGLLILAGMMLRHLGLGGRNCAELLSAGDLLRPWQGNESKLIEGGQARWQAIEPSRIAILDLGFARRISPFPEVHGEIAARAVRRSRHLALNMAIVQQPKVEMRVLMLLWLLADRCGKVEADGARIPLDLSHSILAELVAARRPTVSAAMASIQRSGKARKVTGGWQLTGDPPDEMCGAILSGRS